MEEALFTWVHLSDIHVGHGDPAHRWDQKMVLREIARDVVAARQEGLDIPAPDALLVTGDVAFSGNGVVRAPDTKSREYEGAKAWLLEVAGKLGLAEKDVFVVPGNHDIDRGKDRDRDVDRLVKALQTGSDTLDAALGSAGDREKLARRMEAYLAFAADFAPACLGPLRPAEERLSWSQRFQRSRGLTVRLVGLNTALLCSGDADFGRLYLGNEQIERGFNDLPIGDQELVIALSHHPLRGWLADAKDAEANLRRYAHLHLSGHVHEAESEESRTGGGSHGFLRVVAGASHAEKQASKEIPAGHGYNFASVVANERGELALRIWPRRWSDENRDFRPDVNKIPRGKRWAEHALGVRVSPVTAPPAKVPEMPATLPVQTPSTNVSTFTPTPTTHTAADPRLPQSGPVRVYVSYAPEDEELCKKLEKHLTLLRRTGYFESTTSRAVDPGGNWRGTVDQRLAEAHVILLLLSDDYLASDYCFDVEMKTAQKRHEAGEAIVIPIVLRPLGIVLGDDGTSKDRSPRLWFQRLSPLPRQPNAKADPEYPRWKPITTWKLEDEAFRSVVVDLRTYVDEARRP
ncbi:Hypothetical protein A7982_01621 [Minicystis rosea]|nr:Hypothetical protein A7982_01621 [Minicystis rosea]